MAKNINKRSDRIHEWLGKVLRGAGAGLLLSVVMLITGAFKGERVGMIIFGFFAYMFIGIGFSFGSLIVKLGWRRFVARGRAISVWAALTSGGYGAFLFTLLLLVVTVAVGWLAGWIIMVADIVCAMQGRRLLSAILEARFGYREYEPAAPADMVEDAVRYNYQNHGTPDAGSTDSGKGFTPTEKQVQDATAKKKNEMW